MSETINTFSTGQEAPIQHLELAEYANGAHHLYAVGPDGKKQHISHDKVLEAWGVEARPASDRSEANAQTEQIDNVQSGNTDVQPDFGDLSPEDQVRELAKWNTQVHTVPGSDGNEPVKGGPKPSKAGLNVDDLRYDMWLKEHAQEPHSGQGVLKKAREEARMQRVREWARLEMRVKTGMATGDEIAYYRTLEDTAEEAKRTQVQNDPDAGRLPMSDELLKQAYAENEGFDTYNSGRAHAENQIFDIYDQAHLENVYDQAHAENRGFDIYNSGRAHAENQRFDELFNELIPGAEITLDEALEEYASISAEQRNGHHGRVEGSRLKAFLRGLSKKRSDAMDAAVNEKQVWYKQRLQDVANLARELYDIKGADANFNGTNELFTHAKVLELRANQVAALEGAIFDHRVEQANESRFAKLNNYLAKSWHSHGKVRRTLVVAALPFAAGAAIGLAATALPAAASIALGAGVAYGGRKLGQEHARRINKVTQYDKDVVVAQATRSAAAMVQSELGRRPVSEINSNIDLTTITEEATTAEVQQNQKRREKIGAIAAVAAGLGYGAGKLTGNMLSSDQATVPGGENPGSDQGGVGRGIDGYGGEHGGGASNGAGHGGGAGGHNGIQTYGDGFNTHNYPWTVAEHYVGPDKAMDTVNQAVSALNHQVAGSPYSVHHVGNSLQVYLNGHAMSGAAQAHFNQLMVQALHLQ